jgi:hypothetical protein
MSFNEARRAGSCASARRTFGGIKEAANAVAARLAEYFSIRRRVILEKFELLALPGLVWTDWFMR